MLPDSLVLFLISLNLNFSAIYSFDQCKKHIYRADVQGEFSAIPLHTKITTCSGADEKCCEDNESCCGAMSPLTNWVLALIGFCILAICLGYSCCRNRSSDNTTEYRTDDSPMASNDDRPPPMTPPPNYEDAIKMPSFPQI